MKKTCPKKDMFFYAIKQKNTASFYWLTVFLLI